jgi:S-adenosylmethionine uptake transporter
MASPVPPPTAEGSRVLRGMLLGVAGYVFFAGQDAIVKKLAETLPVPEILFFRSLGIVALATIVTRGAGLRKAAASRNKGPFAFRAVLILAAWLSYYSASRMLGLAEMVTLYFAAPIFMLLLSMPILGERVTPARWTSVLVGFTGVVLAADPGGDVKLLPALMVIFAAFCWAATAVMVRLIARSETTTTQMIVSNLMFAAACALALPFVWATPAGWQLALLLALGLVGGLGPFLVSEGFRLAPASALAPIEYSALIWAFLLGWLVWGDVPKTVVFLGAGLILLSGAGILIVEGRRRG